VVLVDADLSSRGSSSLIAGSPYPGFGEVVAGAACVEDALRSTMLPDVRLLPAATSGSLSLLDVDNLELMLGELAARDIVVIDGPALLTSPETLVIAGHVDLVLLVADLRTLRRRDVSACLRMLDGAADRATLAWVLHPPVGARRSGRVRSPRKGSFDDDGGRSVVEPAHVIDATHPPLP
jgi:Mrp family chromosome partitioning ATPase